MLATTSLSSLPTNPKSSPQVYLLLLRLEARVPLQEWKVPSISTGAAGQVLWGGARTDTCDQRPAEVLLVTGTSSSPVPSSCHPSRPEGAYCHWPEQSWAALQRALGAVVWASVPLPARRERRRDWHLQSPRRFLPRCSWQTPFRSECRLPIFLKEIWPAQNSGIRLLDVFIPNEGSSAALTASFCTLNCLGHAVHLIHALRLLGTQDRPAFNIRRFSLDFSDL